MAKPQRKRETFRMWAIEHSSDRALIRRPGSRQLWLYPSRTLARLNWSPPFRPVKVPVTVERLPTRRQKKGK